MTPMGSVDGPSLELVTGETSLIIPTNFRSGISYFIRHSGTTEDRASPSSLHSCHPGLRTTNWCNIDMMLITTHCRLDDEGNGITRVQKLYSKTHLQVQ